MTVLTARCPPARYVRLSTKKRSLNKNGTEHKQDETKYTYKM